MASNRLRLWKGYNNGVSGGIVYLLAQDGTATPMDLTGATVEMEIYTDAGVVLATISGTIEGDPEDGQYSVIPGATDLDDLTSGEEYNYRIKVTQNPTYPDGLLFEEDEAGRLRKCVVV